MATSQSQKCYPGGQRIYNFGVGLPGLQKYEFSFFFHVQRSRQFSNFCSAPRTPVGPESWNLKFMFLLPLKSLKPHLKRFGHACNFKKQLKIFKCYHMMTTDGNQLQWVESDLIRWPKNMYYKVLTVHFQKEIKCILCRYWCGQTAVIPSIHGPIQVWYFHIICMWVTVKYHWQTFSSLNFITFYTVKEINHGWWWTTPCCCCYIFYWIRTF